MTEINRESYAKTLSEAVNSKTKFIEVNEQRFAYRSIGTGLPIILLNRFRGTLDTWDPAFLGGLAATFNVITIDYSGVGQSTGKCASDVLSMAKDVKAVAEALKLSKFIIAGWSLGGMVTQTIITKYPALVSRAILIGATPPGKNTGVPEKEFWDRALKPVNDLDDGIVLFFEPKSESSKNAAKLSFGRMAQRTDDLDIPMSKDCWDNQRKAIEDFREDKYNTLKELKKSTIPSLLLMGDHDIGFHVEDWYPLIGDLESTQVIVLPRAGHAPHHQYPDLVANYITGFIHGWQ
ncbi:MAG: alpha/beta fold hydrolase [Nitrososphaeraceae archaeon]